MARLFDVVTDPETGERTLCPHPDEKFGASLKRVQECIDLGDRIPGCYTDEAGNVTGGNDHAIGTLLKSVGQNWGEGQRTSPVRTDPTRFDLPKYQQYGAMFTMNSIESGVLNYDDMGLGKTVQSIAALSSLDPHVAKLVLCPAFLRTQWQGEIERWAPRFSKDGMVPSTSVVFPASDRRSKLPPSPDAEWVIAYYLDFERALKLIGKRSYFLLMDEVHNVRGYGTRRLEQLAGASTWAAGRLGLTGSPLYNEGAKLFPILDLIQPRAWGSYTRFATRYSSAVQGAYSLEIGKLSQVGELRERMATMSFRRAREEVADQLPFDTKYQTVWLDRGGSLASTKAAINNLGARQTYIAAVARAKVEPVSEQVKLDQSASIPSITFTYLKDQARAIAGLVPDSLVVTGEDASANRLGVIDNYVKKCKAMGKVPALVATLDSLSEGANLQWAKVINLASLDYTPDKLRQAIARAARMGQTGTVNVRIYACKGTIDEHYMRVLKEKLVEQFKLDGRKEKSKADLHEALGGAAVKDALQQLYERMLKEELSNGS